MSTPAFLACLSRKTLLASSLVLTLASCLSLALACETDSSPGEQLDNPPPPPSRTPTHLRHGPNTGIYDMSNELSEEEAAKLGKPPKGETSDAQPEEEAGEEAGTEQAE